MTRKQLLFQHTLANPFTHITSLWLFHCCATFQGVENVYAQHVPLMMTTVEAALKGKLKDGAYPSVGPAGGKPLEVSDIILGASAHGVFLCCCVSRDKSCGVLLYILA